jgi:hypothetical protein
MPLEPDQTPVPADWPTELDPYYAQIYREIGESAVTDLLKGRDDLTLEEARAKVLELALMMRRQAEDTTEFMKKDLLLPHKGRKRKKHS